MPEYPSNAAWADVIKLQTNTFILSYSFAYTYLYRQLLLLYTRTCDSDAEMRPNIVATFSTNRIFVNLITRRSSGLMMTSCGNFFSHRFTFAAVLADTTIILAVCATWRTDRYSSNHESECWNIIFTRITWIWKFIQAKKRERERKQRRRKRKFTLCKYSRIGR